MGIKRYELNDVQWARIAPLLPGKVGDPGRTGSDIHVLPMATSEVMASDAFRRGVAKLNDRERGELRRLMVATMAEVMRDSGNPEIRADAYNVLKDMGVVRP